MKNKMQVDFAQYENTLALLDQCTNDYMFILDFINDHFAISKSALEIFALKDAHFSNAMEVFKNITYSGDYDKLKTDLDLIKDGKRTEHKLEYRWIDRKGNPIWISCKGKVVQEDNGIPRYLVGRISEIGKQSKIDNITSLYRENVFKARYEELCSVDNFNGFVMSIGIDNFKEINEKYGMEFGDKILYNVANCIKSTIRQFDIEVFRLDGDEFLLFCSDFDYHREDKLIVKELYKNIRREVDKTIEKSGYQIFYTISAGLLFFDTEYWDYKSIMRGVRFALHNAKLNGKNTYFEYNEDTYLKYIRKLDIQENLRKSIQNDYDGFELYYQPIVDLEQNAIIGAEALVRWSSENYGFMSPVEFVPLLEESSLIIPLGKWIIKSAVMQCKKWSEKIPNFKMNINLSFVQLQKSDIVKDALECIDSLDIPHEQIIFEVTESGELSSSQITRNVIKSFSEKEIELAIDDFGTGYSNFSYIKDMQFGLIKIDRAFIKNIHNSDYDYRLVKHMTDMAHSLNFRVCFEGVETENELEIVKSLKPDCIQGFYFGRPVNPIKFSEKFL